MLSKAVCSLMRGISCRSTVWLGPRMCRDKYNCRYLATDRQGSITQKSQPNHSEEQAQEDKLSYKHEQSEGPIGGYSYFTKLASHAEKQPRLNSASKLADSTSDFTESVSISGSDALHVKTNKHDSQDNTTTTSVAMTTDDPAVTIETGDELIGQEYLTSKPEILPVKTTAQNLAVYVNQSDTLRKLVEMGVDLSEVERMPEAANMIIKMDFLNDIQPYLLFLRDVGVTEEDLSCVLSKNPLLLREDMDDLRVRVNYFESKKFSTEAIVSIIVRRPTFLLMSTQKIDRKMGFYQQEFQLTGDQVRDVITKLPKLILTNLQQFKETKFHLKEFLGFTDKELKEIFIAKPKVFLSSKFAMADRFDFLHNTIGLSHERLVQFPNCLRCRLHILKQRHKFLLSLDRAQYDPTKENYISLQALVSKNERDWCKEVAKSSWKKYQEFLKTL